MSSISNNLGVGGIGPIDLSSMDLETALMSVQQQRTQLLDDSLQAQIDGINERNKQMAGMNDKLTGLSQANTELTASNVDMTAQIAELKDLQGKLAASKCPDPEGYYGLSWGQGDDAAASHAMLAKVKEMGLTVPTGADAPVDTDRNGTMDAKGRVVQGWVDEIGGKVAALEAKVQANETAIADNKNAIDATKRDIDSLSNSQQMDMLRLQSTSNKRNEAFDVMTNFIKKLQDNRASIVGNMK